MKIDHALSLAAEGFHVFPLEPGTKVPHIDDFPHKASRDPEQIKRWWTCPVTELPQDFNIGMSTSKFGDSKALLVVDVDNKGDKNGSNEILRLEVEGYDFPPTRVQSTPTGGLHFVYSVDQPVKQGINVVAQGVDVRSAGGYIVGSGSVIGDKCYGGDKVEIAQAPVWLVDRCGKARRHVPVESRTNSSKPVDHERAVRRAVEFLEQHAPLAVEGRGGDHTTFAVAAKLKDIGLPASDAADLMLDHWNDRCSPPWSEPEIVEKVNNAYRYGKEAPGSAAPEVQFAVQNAASTKPGETVPEDAHPFQILNREYAFVIAGGGHHILWETKDENGVPSLEHLSAGSFHAKHAAWHMQLGNKSKPVTELWMADPSRRSYDGICFMPGLPSPERFYNLWRGFAVEPATETLTKETLLQFPGVAMFLEHLHQNVCNKDKALLKWLLGYFAHMIQRPWEKPLVAIVFRGGKGVGKSAAVERIGALLGHHFLATSNRRYLVGNFNAHLEHCLLFSLEEAFWSGDKQAEGMLKDLITGSKHVVEYKGKEPYTVDNRTRIVVIGNEDWLVPASHDERRFAVFDVGLGRAQDRTFFAQMRTCMEQGEYSVLLRYFLDFDLTGLDINQAPNTKGLLEQKHASLEPLEQWWLDCLSEGNLVGGEFTGNWPEEVETERFRRAFGRYLRDRQIRSRMPDSRSIGRMLGKCLPSAGKQRKRHDNVPKYFYKLPPLEVARSEWEKHIGHEVTW